MVIQTIPAKIKIRRSNYDEWMSVNPILEEGEMSFVTQGEHSGKIKIGDGVTPWRLLPFTIGADGIQGEKGDDGLDGSTFVILPNALVGIIGSTGQIVKPENIELKMDDIILSTHNESLGLIGKVTNILENHIRVTTIANLRGKTGDTGKGIYITTNPIQPFGTDVVMAIPTQFVNSNQVVLQEGDLVISNSQSTLGNLGVIVKVTSDLMMKYVGNIRGIQGEKGDKGDQGNIGNAPSITIGTVNTVQPGTQASATITGTNPNYNLNLNIPRGYDGVGAEIPFDGNGFRLTYIQNDGIKQFTVNVGQYNNLFNIQTFTNISAGAGNIINLATQLLGVEFGIDFNFTSLSSSFLSGAKALCMPLKIPNCVTNIGINFMRYCNTFNTELILPDNITSIPDNFMEDCSLFNQPFKIPESVTSIGNRFMANCSKFNSELILPDGITTIGNNFMTGCLSFNKELNLPRNLTFIDNMFLVNNTSFNKPINIKNNVTSIGLAFLSTCTSFNTPITIPNSVTQIGESFLVACESFNQPLVLHNNINSIGPQFLRNCFNFTNSIHVSTNAPAELNTLSTLGALNTNKPLATTGVTIYGPNRQDWINRLPNNSNRKITDGGR